MLRQFYGEVRKRDGTEYSKNALMGIRSAIHRHITSAPHHRSFNIMKDPEFKAANNVLIGTLKQQKRQGKNKTKSLVAITPEDMKKLFDSGVMSTGSPEGLQNLVWFSLQFYLCRRGCEGVQDLKKDSFEFLVDSAGKEYVQLAFNEASKNHPGGFAETNDPIRKMYATGEPMCPVQALRLYLSKLHQNQQALYQQIDPKSRYDDACWYLQAQTGQKKLQGMMAKLSVEAELSRRYTNHCLRATCISTLMNSGFDPLTVTRLSGHRNIQSVLSYCKDVGDNTKRRMAETLTSSLTGTHPIAAPPATATLQSVTSPWHPPTLTARPLVAPPAAIARPLVAPPAAIARQQASPPAAVAHQQALPPIAAPPAAVARFQPPASRQQPSALNSIHLQRQDNTASLFSNCSIDKIQIFYGQQ